MSSTPGAAGDDGFPQLPEGKVKLVSGDGFQFIIDDEAARVSSTIRGMLDSQGMILRWSDQPSISPYGDVSSLTTPRVHVQATSKKPNRALFIYVKSLPEC